MPTFDYELAATVLAESCFSDDKTVLDKYEISPRTLRRWRERLHSDSHLAAFVQGKKAAIETAWASELSPAIRAGVDFLRRAASTADPTDPAAIRAVAEALKTLAEIEMTKGLLDARLPGAPRASA